MEQTELTRIQKPDGLPEAWEDTPGTLFDGKCGLTAVSNLARLYGKEIAPKSIDKSEYRSWGFGLRKDKCAENLTKLVGLSFLSLDIKDDDPLIVLKGYIKQNKPVAIMYMEDSTAAHWVVVVGVNGQSLDPKILVASWGKYYSIPWRRLSPAWQEGYGGPYPHVVCESASNFSL